MALFSTKTLRSLLQRILFLFPRSTRASVDRWIRGKKEYKKLKKADFAVVSLPKSGRTWLRVMLSRYYQQKFDLPEHSVIGSDNFYLGNRAAPRVLFHMTVYCAITPATWTTRKISITQKPF